MMNSKRQEKILNRRKEMPRAYRAVYDKAVEGKSLRAAVNSQCLQCCWFQIVEIRNCTDPACPLYAVRPYQVLQKGHDEGFNSAESINSVKGDHNVR